MIEERDNERLPTAEARCAQYLPADCFIRALALEVRGQLAQARLIEQMVRLHATPE